MVATERIVGFSGFLRSHGVRVGVQETLDALKAARVGVLESKQAFRSALRSLHCTSRQEAEKFDALFEAYWAESTPFPSAPQRSKPAAASDPLGRVRKAPTAFRMGAAQQSASDREGSATSSASRMERLRKTAFPQLTLQDQEALEELALRLWQQMSVRLSRRLRTSGLRRQVDLRRTIRRNLQRGGHPFELVYRGRQRKRPRLVALLDVSGSMDQYSLLLLRFLHALEKHFRSIDSFLFSTRLTPISAAMRRLPLQETLQVISRQDLAWSSGTRIGECLREFNLHHARRTLSRSTMVLVFSDGLDTGPPAVLAAELEKIRWRARKLVWLNPLLGTAGYQPLAQGMSAALPWIDVFAAAHNLDSLLALERHLQF